MIIKCLSDQNEVALIAVDRKRCLIVTEHFFFDQLLLSKLFHSMADSLSLDTHLAEYDGLTDFMDVRK